jgi:hypothetical protein
MEGVWHGSRLLNQAASRTGPEAATRRIDLDATKDLRRAKAAPRRHSEAYPWP